MDKERYIKPEVKTETLEAEVLSTQWGSPAGSNNGSGPFNSCPGC